MRPTRYGIEMKRLRVKAGLTQLGLAEALGMTTHTNVSRVENGSLRVLGESHNAQLTAVLGEPDGGWADVYRRSTVARVDMAKLTTEQQNVVLAMMGE